MNFAAYMLTYTSQSMVSPFYMEHGAVYVNVYAAKKSVQHLLSYLLKTFAP